MRRALRSVRVFGRIRPVFTREQILEEIRRAAEENGGKPVGRARFIRLTGITEYALFRHWPRYGDAVRDAGLEPNVLNAARDDAEVLKRFVELTRRLGQAPTLAELRIARNDDSSFPSPGVFERLGSKNERIGHALQFCRENPSWDDVVVILETAYMPAKSFETQESMDQSQAVTIGFVYLAKGHPGEFKIGRTNLVDRRLSELGVTSAIKPVLVHEIKTDDPVGVEAYWHRRFAEKRLGGEWFRLAAADVAAFRRWRRVY